MLTHPTHDRLIALGLTGWPRRSKTSAASPMCHAPLRGTFAMMIDREAIERENKRLERRLKAASLRQSAIVEDIDHKAPRGLDRALLKTHCRRVDRTAPEFARHRPNRRRQKLDCLRARPQGLPRRPLRLYHRVPRLFDALALARGDGRYARLLKNLARADLLILDDWGLAAHPRASARPSGDHRRPPRPRLDHRDKPATG